MSFSRLVRALWAPEHLFLVHLDVRTNSSTVDRLRSHLANVDNVHFDRIERRAVGWGAYSMITVLLAALRVTLLSSPRCDFFINLSDADVALRHGAELAGFLSRFRGTVFVLVWREMVTVFLMALIVSALR